MAIKDRHDKSVRPPTDLILVASGQVATDTPLPEETRGLLIGTAGNLNITTTGGNRDSVPFQAGMTPICATAIRVSNGMGDASNIWAVI